MTITFLPDPVPPFTQYPGIVHEEGLG